MSLIHGMSITDQAIDDNVGAKNPLPLTNLQNGIVDPAMPPDIALEMTTWALQVAKSEGAETARQALDLIRYSPTTDGVWAEYRDHLEWTWRHLPELD